jgi:hypothetical protein
MSLILDALRKSERSRQQSLSGRVGTVGTPPTRTHMPVPWSTLIGLLLAINALALAVLYWRSNTSHDAAAVPANAPYHPEVRPLAEEAPASQPPGGNRGAATTPSASPEATAPPISAPAAVPDPAATVDKLPDVRSTLPSLHLDVHAYASKPADRFVVINLHRYQVGDTLAEGPRVVDITPQGVVLEYQGSTFLLPRQ